MSPRRIVVTETDRDRLKSLIADLVGGGRPGPDLKALSAELDQALIVSQHRMPSRIVTMNTEVVLRDADTLEELTCRLVFPVDADAATGAISVLAPVGTAILGYAEGDVIEWPVPVGSRRLRIERVLYQPEAAGDWNL